jgi:AcrR family transcriptional regulator
MVEVAAERGASNVSVAHVVERAGVSRRTFYELYGDHEACFLGAFDDAYARASQYVLDGYDPSAKWAERVRVALTNLLCFLDRSSPWCDGGFRGVCWWLLGFWRVLRVRVVSTR